MKKITLTRKILSSRAYLSQKGYFAGFLAINKINSYDGGV